MKFYVYILYNKLNLEPFYVGKGSGMRIYRHYVGAYTKSKNHLHHKIAKITREGNAPTQVLYWCESEEEAFFYETELIAHFGRKDLKKGPLLNRTDGGDGMSGHILSAETKAKMSASKKGKLRSIEARASIAAGHKGKKRKPFSEQHKLNMGIANRHPWSAKAMTNNENRRLARFELLKKTKPIKYAFVVKLFNRDRAKQLKRLKCL